MATAFDLNGYSVLNNVITVDMAEVLAASFINLRNFVHLRDGKDLSEIGYFNDEQVVKSFAQYGLPSFDALLEHLRPVVEDVVDKELYPTYSYARIYYNDAEMASHIDRASCEYSMTLTLKTDGNLWPIWFTDKQNVTKELLLDVGCGCVYKGMELPHWRTSFTGSQQIQVFLHYVDKNGPHAGLKYDGRSMLGVPKSFTA